MANRFWVGGNGTWNGTAGTKWATTSGGAGGAAVPTSADDVFLDGASGANTVTVNAVATCLSLNCTGFTGTLTNANNTAIDIYGSCTLVAGMTLSGTFFSFNFRATAIGKTVTMGGKTIQGFCQFLGVGGGWTLQDALAVAAGFSLSLFAGTLDTNGKAVTGGWQITPSSTATLTLGASTLTADSWNLSSSNLTFNANTSTINYTGSGTFAGGGVTYATVAMVATGNLIINGANTFGTLTVTGPNALNTLITLGGNQTVTGTFTINGNSASKRLLVFPGINNAGRQKTLTAAVVSMTNTDFMDINFAGSGTWSGTSIGNAGNNTGLTATTPVTRYWVGGSGNWSDTNHWSTSTGGSSGASVPICHDTAVFDANSVTSASQTITFDTTLIAGFSMTGVANNPTFNFDSVDNYWNGNVTLQTGVTYSWANIKKQYYMARGTVTLITNGVSMDISSFHGLYIQGGMSVAGASTGTVQLGDNLTMADTVVLQLGSGTFDFNDHNATIGAFVAADYTSGGIVKMGTGTIIIRGDENSTNLGNGFYVFNIEPIGTGAGNIELQAETSTLILRQTTDASRTISTDGTGAMTLYNVIFDGTVPATSTSHPMAIQNGDDFTCNEFHFQLEGAMKYLQTGGGTFTAAKAYINGQYGTLPEWNNNGGGVAVAFAEYHISYMSITPNFGQLNFSPAVRVVNCFDGTGNTGITFDTWKQTINFA